jgi:hypothetical protein
MAIRRMNKIGIDFSLSILIQFDSFHAEVIDINGFFFIYLNRFIMFNKRYHDLKCTDCKWNHQLNVSLKKRSIV